MNEEQEWWMVVAGYPKYEVSNRGRVQSLYAKHPKILKHGLHPRGYHQVSLHRNGQQDSKFVHLLVLDAFGPPKPSNDHQCNHIDGDKANNRIENLEWTTAAENTRHAIENGLRQMTGESNPEAKLTRDDVIEIRQRAAAGESHRRIARDYPVHKKHLDKIVAGTKWAHVPPGTYKLVKAPDA